MSDSREGKSLFARTAHGAGWMVAWRATTRILGLASTLILVRLLEPGDFGLIALAASFVLVVDAFSFIGAEDSLVREKNPSDALLNTAFTLNVLRACASALVVAALAVPAATFFDEPRLTSVILLLAAATALEGFSNIGTVAFRRSMAFEKEFRLQILPRLAGVIVGVTCAVILQNHWALVAGVLVQRVLRVGFSYAMHPFRPSFSLQEWRSIAAFSVWAWAIMVALQIRERSESIIIGRLLGTTYVGIYDTGKEIALLPTSELVHPACHAAYSAFAQSRNDGDHPGDACLRVMGLLTLVSLPAGFGLSLIAAPLVRLAFGPQWLEAIPVIQALGIAGAFAVFGIVCGTLLRAHGLMRVSFRMTLIGTPVRILILLVVIPWGGLQAAAIAVAGVLIASRFGTLFVTFRHFHIPLSSCLTRVWRSLAAVAVMALALWWSGLGWTPRPPDSIVACALQIAESVSLGASVYVAVVVGLWLACGRPAGGEADALAIARRMLDRVAARLSR